MNRRTLLKMLGVAPTIPTLANAKDPVTKDISAGYRVRFKLSAGTTDDGHKYIGKVESIEPLSRETVKEWKPFNVAYEDGIGEQYGA